MKVRELMEWLSCNANHEDKVTIHNIKKNSYLEIDGLFLDTKHNEVCIECDTWLCEQERAEFNKKWLGKGN